MTNGLRRAGTCPPVRESLDGASAKFKPWTLPDLRRGVATGMAEQLGTARRRGGFKPRQRPQGGRRQDVVGPS